jgi:hypothetical protein
MQIVCIFAVIVMNIAGLYSGVPQPQLRSSNLAQDAVGRSLSAVREAQKFAGQVPHVYVSMNKLVSAQQLQRLMKVNVQQPASYVVVQTISVDGLGSGWIFTYAYDPRTHLLRYETDRKILPRRNSLTPPPPSGPCPQ